MGASAFRMALNFGKRLKRTSSIFCTCEQAVGTPIVSSPKSATTHVCLRHIRWDGSKSGLSGLGKRGCEQHLTFVCL